jgi:hypothetical protein
LTLEKKLHLLKKKARLWGKKAGPGRSFLGAAFVLILLAALPLLHARGQQDDSLSRADALIAEKRYAEALTILSAYAQRSPQDFDRAQSRIRKIVTARDEYNSTAQELLDTLGNDPWNTDRILHLTNLLFELDPSRITETEDFISRTRDLALFTTNRRRLEEILLRGKNLIAQGNYTEALRTYTGGLDIYQTEFFRAGYDGAMEARVRQGIGGLNANAALFYSLLASLWGAVNGLENLAGQPVEAANLTVYRNAYQRVGAELDRLSALRSAYAGTETAFQEDLSRIQRSNPRTGDRNFLAFALRLMEGYPDDSGDGMLGVLDTLWNQAASRTRDLLDAKSQLAYAAARNEAAAGDYRRTGSRAEILTGYAALPVDLEIRWNRYDPSAQGVSFFNQPVLSAEAGNYLKFRALSEMPPYLGTLGALGLRLNALEDQDTAAAWRNGGNGEDLLRLEQSSVNALRQIRIEAQGLAAALGEDAAGYRNLETRYPGSGALAYIDQTGALISSLVNAVSSRENLSSGRRFTIANGMLEGRLVQREAEFQEGSTLFQGTRGQDDHVSRYPTQAAEVLSRMDAALEADAQTLRVLLDQYAAEPAGIVSTEPVRSLRDQALALRERLETVRSQGRSLAQTARTQSSQAAALRRNGDQFLAETRTALDQGNFDAARDRLLRAGNAYDQSLGIEDNEAVRNQRNDVVPALDGEIAKLENEAVLRDVRGLMAQVTASYFNGDFEGAENLLTRAQNTWKRTQLEDNPEIVYWLGLVRSGLRAGRTIPVTAPLYAEMSQFLSEAQKHYEAGNALISSSRDEGIRRLSLARENVQKVKLVYPMNEKAGLLDLQIDQLVDPNFAATFQERVNRAIAGCRRREMRAYNDLLNLRTINPRYPNWSSIVAQAEIDVGLRPPPPSPAALARSGELTAGVRSIVTSRNGARMEEARTALAEAISLNPGNQEAIGLFNLASQLIIGGTVVLDSEAERKYQQAIAALSQNNALGALSLVQEIYARNPQYRYNSRVNTLEQRARASL